MARLTKEIFDQIIERKAKGERVKALCKEYNVCDSSVYKMIREYNHVETALNNYQEIIIGQNETICFKLNNYSIELQKSNLKTFLEALL